MTKRIDLIPVYEAVRTGGVCARVMAWIATPRPEGSVANIDAYDPIDAPEWLPSGATCANSLKPGQAVAGLVTRP